jgi:DNA-binding CsgD family transcriptional regulator
MNGLLSGSADDLCASAEEARRLARSVDDSALDIMALSDQGLALVASGQVRDGMRMLDESMAGLGTLDQRREVVVWASCNMLAACALVDDIVRATQWCRAADEFMATHGCPFLQARCRAHYGQVLLASGDWARAEGELLQALAMAEDVGRGPRLEALAALADLRTRQGRPEEALRLLAELSPTTTAGVVAEARAQIALGRASDAVATLRAQLAVLAPGSPDLALVRAVLVEAHVVDGQLDTAASILDGATDLDITIAHPRPRALLLRAAGLLAGARQDDGAARLLTDALERFDGSNLPFEAARTRLDLATVLAGEDRDAAVGHALRALTAFRALGASGAEGQAAALLRRLGHTPAPAARDAGELTRREREVLQLVAAGLSNPQIAERLFLSRKTVAHHVSHILAKLGLATRSEAAAYAVRHGDL